MIHEKKVKELLKEFQNMSATEPGYVAKLKEIWAPLAAHMEEEEKHDLPMLESALAAGESETLSDRFVLTKKFVPTRSHPSAGEHPPFETVMGLMTAPMDKVADAFRKFPQSKSGLSA